MDQEISNVSIMEDDDEWYDRSITDYRELIMLEVENKPLQLTVGSHDTLYVLEEKKLNEQILSLQKLPDKIIEACQQTVVKGSYLKILAGTFLDTKIKKMHALYGQDRLIASEATFPGLSLFKVNPDTDVIVKDPKRLAETSPIEPHFCQVNHEVVALTKTGSKAAYSYNLASGSLHSLKLEEMSMLSSNSNLIPFTISSHSIAVGVENTGHIFIYDLRSYSPVLNIQGNSTAKWSFAASHKAIPSCQDSNVIAMVSERGSASFYDMRNVLQPLVIGQVSGFPLQVRMSPYEKYLSVSDSQGFVKIYSFSSKGIVNEFTHEGHLRMEHCERTAKTTDHLWYTASTLISSADNSTVNLWQFNISH